MRIVALYRVSASIQEERGASLDAQRRRYRELAAHNGWRTVAEFRGTESATAAARERRVLQRVLEAIRAGGIDAVWVIEQSRLTRGDELEVALLMRELREREIAVWVDNTRRDLADPSDGLAFGIVSLVDRAEVQRFRERTQRGKREKARQGRWTAGSAPHGYRNPPAGDPRRGQLQPHPEHAPVIRRIFAEAASGRSLGAIATALDAEGIRSPRGSRWRKSMIRVILDNPVYLGRLVSGAWSSDSGGGRRRDWSAPGAIVVEDAHEALIDDRTWEAVRARRGGSSTGRPGMLTGLLWINGRRVVIDTSRGARYYRPSRGRGTWVKVEPVNELVWAGFTELLLHPETIAALLEREAAPTNREADILAMEGRRGKLLARIDRLVIMRADGEIDRETYAAQTGAAQSQIRSLEESIRSARRQAEALQSGWAQDAIVQIADLVTQPLEPSMQRQALHSVVDRVDATVRRQAQPKVRGRWVSAPQWVVDDVHLGFRHPGPSTNV